MPSAMGLLQILPRHIIRIFMAAKITEKRVVITMICGWVYMGCVPEIIGIYL
jgi:hypothetical protein